MSDKVWQLIGRMIWTKHYFIIFLCRDGFGFFFSATSVLCLVVVLDMTIIIIYLIIQSHKCTSCMKFCVGGINSACSFQILQQVLSQKLNFRGFPWNGKMSSSLCGAQMKWISQNWYDPTSHDMCKELITPCRKLHKFFV